MKKIAIFAFFCTSISAEQSIDFNTVLNAIRNEPNLSPYSMVAGYDAKVQQLRSDMESNKNSVVLSFLQAEKEYMQAESAYYKAQAAYNTAREAYNKAREGYVKTQYYEDLQDLWRLYEYASATLSAAIKDFENKTDNNGYSLLDNAVARGLGEWVAILLKAGIPVTDKTLAWLGSPQMQTEGLSQDDIDAVHNYLGSTICQAYEIKQKEAQTPRCDQYRHYYSGQEGEGGTKGTLPIPTPVYRQSASKTAQSDVVAAMR